MNDPIMNDLDDYERRQELAGDLDEDYAIQQLLTTEDGQVDVMDKLFETDEFKATVALLMEADIYDIMRMAAFAINISNLAEAEAKKIVERM